jgi:hypothetical protein
MGPETLSKPSSSRWPFKDQSCGYIQIGRWNYRQSEDPNASTEAATVGKSATWVCDLGIN